MPKNLNKNFWENSTPKFQKIHFIIAILAVCVIIPSSLYIYKSFYPQSFTPDVNEINQIPPNVQQLENQLLTNPSSSTSANVLTEDLPKPPNVEVPSSFKIPILLYHYVEYVKDRGDKTRISLDVLPSIFESQVQTLKGAGYTFMTPADIPLIFEGKEKLPVKPVILSFDDGYRDFYTDVYPILKKYQVKAVEYVVSGFLDKPNNLTRKQLEEIAQSGLVEIGAHTVHHPNLASMSDAKAKVEIEQSKIALEQELHIPVISFAYPYGAFSLNTIGLVKNAGLKTAVSTVAGDDINKENLFFLYRLRPGARSGQSLLTFLSQTKY